MSKARNKNRATVGIPIPPHTRLPVPPLSTVEIPLVDLNHTIFKAKKAKTYIKISKAEIVECIDAAYKLARNSNPSTTGIDAVANLFSPWSAPRPAYRMSYHSKASSH